MIAWFLKSLGISEEIAARLGNAELFWARPLVLWIGLALLAPTVIFIVLRHRRNLPHVSPGMRRLLSACRAGVLLLLIIALAGPSLRLDEQVTQKPVLAVVLDESASMSLPAGPFEEQEALKIAAAAGFIQPPAKGAPPMKLLPDSRKKLNAMSRQMLLDAVLAHQKTKLLKPLADRFDVRVYRTARQVRSGKFGEAAREPISAADSQETDLGGAMEKALDDAVGKTLAGVILISDGRWTSGPDPAVVAQRLTLGAATQPGESANAGVTPVWAVPVGSAQPMSDVSLVDILAPSQVAKDDTVSIMATVDSQGFDNRTVQVKLSGSDGKTIDSKPLTLSSAERQQVQLTFQARQPGATLLTVAVDELPEEQARQNNRQRVMIQVDTEKQKVLYLEGSPRWDFRFLDHALRRDNGLATTLVMEAQLQAYGVLPAELSKIARLPQDAAGFAEYNTILLGDISPTLLPVRLQEQLAKAVEEDGVGLIVQAGGVHMPQDFAGMPLARLLPVKIMGAGEGQGRKGQGPGGNNPDTAGERALGPQPLALPAGLAAPDFQPFHMRVTATGAIHPAFQLYESATQNRSLWSRMPEFYWAAAVEDGGPTTSVLARLEMPGDSKPLIAEHYAGRGRVMFIGTDSTYRWRRNIGSHLFYRFWGQAIRYVARNKEHAGDRSWMEVSPGRVEPGESVSIELFAVDSQGWPLDRPSLSVQVTGTDMADRITLSRGLEAGHFRGTWQPRNTGPCRLSYSDARGRLVTAAVEVEGSGRELRRPSVDRDLLGSLADATGGGVLELYELDRLPEVLKARPVTLHQPHESEIWDNWLMLLLLTGLYCTDVGVRRLLGLT